MALKYGNKSDPSLGPNFAFVELSSQSVIGEAIEALEGEPGNARLKELLGESVQWRTGKILKVKPRHTDRPIGSEPRGPSSAAGSRHPDASRDYGDNMDSRHSSAPFRGDRFRGGRESEFRDSRHSREFDRGREREFPRDDRNRKRERSRSRDRFDRHGGGGGGGYSGGGGGGDRYSAGNNNYSRGDRNLDDREPRFQDRGRNSPL